MRPLSRTVFSQRRLHASATPLNPSRGESGVHHLRPMVNFRRSTTLFASVSASVA